MHEEEKDLHYENYKVLMKENNKNINKKVFHVHGLEELIVKMSILSKAIYKFNSNSINTPMTFCYGSRKTLLKFI